MADKRSKATREKAISYRHAIWLKAPPKGSSLESFIRETHEKLHTLSMRHIQRDKQVIKSAKPEDVPEGGILLHFTADTPGEFATIVKSGNADSEDLETDTAPAPADSEYMDADAFVLIVSNNVFVCASGFRDKAIRYILGQLMQKAGLSEFSDQFDLIAAANGDKVQMIHAEGVAEIDLRASMYAATGSYLEHKFSASGFMGQVSDALVALGGIQDDEVGTEGSAENDDIKISISLKGTGRFSKGMKVGHRKINDIAAKIVDNADENDEFKILTRSGRTISQSEVYIKTKVLMERNGKTVRKKSAWEELVKFYKGLKDDNALEG